MLARVRPSLQLRSGAILPDHSPKAFTATMTILEPYLILQSKWSRQLKIVPLLPLKIHWDTGGPARPGPENRHIAGALSTAPIVHH